VKRPAENQQTPAENQQRPGPARKTSRDQQRTSDKGVIFPPETEPGVLVFSPTDKRGIHSPREENHDKGVIFPTYTTRGLFSPQSTRGF
jgi:hypothetical protein